MPNFRPVVLDSIDEWNHVVLYVHYVGDHGVLRVRLDEGTSGVVRQAPHVVILVVDPIYINRFILFSIVPFITAILVQPSIVRIRAYGRGRGGGHRGGWTGLA